MNKPFFTIIIPTYNQADFLVKALESLIAQTDPDWEAVVVNDGSTDNTSEVLEHFSKHDERIRVFHKKNGGTGSALNEGLRNALGRWICWLSSDDMFAPRKLEIHREWIGKHPDCKFFFTYFRLLREATGEMAEHDLWGPLPDRAHQIVMLFYRNYISGITICIERESWLRIGCFDEKLRYAQDYGMWLRILAKHPALFIPEWTCINRNHDGQGSEVFPQACYFDTAKAGINFINTHSFKELFPLVDFSDPGSISETVARTLEISSEPTAFLYALGPHMALLSRLLELVLDPDYSGTLAGKKARQTTERMMKEYAPKVKGTILEAIWQEAEDILLTAPQDYAFTPIIPGELGKGFYRLIRDADKPQAEALKKYLAQFEGIHIIDRLENDLETEESQPAASGPQSGKASRDGRQQVIFIQRAIWGGGAEQVVRNITHGLDHEKFEPIVIHLFAYTGGGAEAYDPAVQIHCVEPILRDLLEQSIQTQPHSPVQAPEAIIPLPGPSSGFLWRIALLLSAHVPPGKVRSALSLVWRLIRYRKIHNLSSVLLAPSPQSASEQVPEAKSTLTTTPASTAEKTFCIRAEVAEVCHPLMEIWPTVRALHNLLSSFSPDAILVPVMEEAAVRVWMSQLLQKRPYIVSLHSVESYNLRLMYPDNKRFLVEKWLFENACRGALCVTTPSQGCKQDLVSLVDVSEEAVKVLENPVACDKAVRKSHEMIPDFPKRKTIFIQAGRLSEDKNPILMLEAAALLKQSYRDFVVICLGKGDMEPEIRRLIHERNLEDDVLLLGEVANPFPYMAAARGLILTSHAESFGLVLVEAMLCGVVPISVDCPYGPREILDDGKYGILIPPNNAEALAEAMLRLALDDDLYESYRKLGVPRAREFDVSRIIPRWEELLNKTSATPRNNSACCPQAEDREE